MLCSGTAKLQQRRGENLSFWIAKGILTAFSSCKTIIFLSYNMIYKPLLSFRLLMRIELKIKCIFSKYKILPGVDQMKNKASSRVYQNLSPCRISTGESYLPQYSGLSWTLSLYTLFLGDIHLPKCFSNCLLGPVRPASILMEWEHT